MPTFTYIADRRYYVTRPIPELPNSVEYLFYIRGKDLPEGVPHGCNPRHQNIDARIYRLIADSYRSDVEHLFHTRNKGITTLVTSVTEEYVGSDVHLTVNIPDELGNVDGEHTNQIIQKHKSENPNQWIAVALKMGYPSRIISPVAAGLNTSMQVTSASMADHYGLFSEVREVLNNQPYANWIGYKQNADGISATSKHLVSFMWCCNPFFFMGDSQKHPSWVFSRAAAVFDRFYNTTDLSPAGDQKLRQGMLQMVKVLPDIIDLYCYINETVPNYFKKSRKSRVRHANGYGEKCNEISVSDLCVVAQGLPFRDPEDKTKHRQLRDSYLLIITAGLRSLLEAGPHGYLTWRKPLNLSLVRQLLDESLPGIYRELVLQLRQNKRDHNMTSRQPAIWDISNSKISLSYYQRYANQTVGLSMQGPRAKRTRSASDLASV